MLGQFNYSGTSISGVSINGNLYKWGDLERFYSFSYKQTPLNGDVGNGGLNVSEPILYT